MTIRLAIIACAAVWLTGSGSLAQAEQRWHRSHGYWEATHEALYELEHEIALLEADPAVGDGYKAPIIARDSRKIRRLHAALPPAHWRWTVPCCYSRRPIYVR
jgi:hypothetical protein